MTSSPHVTPTQGKGVGDEWGGQWVGPRVLVCIYPLAPAVLLAQLGP